MLGFQDVTSDTQEAAVKSVVDSIPYTDQGNFRTVAVEVEADPAPADPAPADPAPAETPQEAVQSEDEKIIAGLPQSVIDLIKGVGDSGQNQ